ncbi:TPM domain-containing protein [Anaeromicropila populeti]|uniref:Uncharacterized membrane protein YgcG, contains a TPM-fold domain n=1 Tax=Anaeromicropila populeti TaxID=37658 RepID=A0A1I6IAL2_9FIRM|nr:TPM domain-containing protein [Anaeromicropila populeti]SFR63797.1 Uncharacterized membrane protein YgcG, contains a TPM-fold domain [Anaeromicropila populeti]
MSNNTYTAKTAVLCKLILLAITILFVFAIPLKINAKSTDTKKLHDTIHLFNSSNAKKVRSALTKASNSSGLDIIVVTTDTISFGKGATYIENFANTTVKSSADCVILLINIESDGYSYEMKPFGNAKLYLNSYRTNLILGDLNRKGSNYVSAVKQFASSIVECSKHPITYSPVGKSTKIKKLYDKIELFNKTKTNRLKKHLAITSKLCGLDIIVITTDDITYDQQIDYLQNFADTTAASSKDCVLMLINLNPEDPGYEIQGYGKAQKYMNNQTISDTLDLIYPAMKSKRYSSAIYQFADQVVAYTTDVDENNLPIRLYDNTDTFGVIETETLNDKLLQSSDSTGFDLIVIMEDSLDKEAQKDYLDNFQENAGNISKNSALMLVNITPEAASYTIQSSGSGNKIFGKEQKEETIEKLKLIESDYMKAVETFAEDAIHYSRIYSDSGDSSAFVDAYGYNESTAPVYMIISLLLSMLIARLFISQMKPGRRGKSYNRPVNYLSPQSSVFLDRRDEHVDTVVTKERFRYPEEHKDNTHSHHHNDSTRNDFFERNDSSDHDHDHHNDNDNDKRDYTPHSGVSSGGRSHSGGGRRL